MEIPFNVVLIPDGNGSLVQRSAYQVKVYVQNFKNNQLAKDEILPGIFSVPDGYYEIRSKQAEGWGYFEEAQ